MAKVYKKIKSDDIFASHEEFAVGTIIENSAGVNFLKVYAGVIRLYDGTYFNGRDDTVTYKKTKGEIVLYNE